MEIELKAFRKENIDQLIKWIKNESDLMQWAGPSYHFPLKRGELLKEIVEVKKNNKILYKVVDTGVSLESFGRRHQQNSDTRQG